MQSSFKQNLNAVQTRRFPCFYHLHRLCTSSFVMPATFFRPILLSTAHGNNVSPSDIATFNNSSYYANHCYEQHASYGWHLLPSPFSQYPPSSPSPPCVFVPIHYIALFPILVLATAVYSVTIPQKLLFSLPRSFQHNLSSTRHISSYTCPVLTYWRLFVGISTLPKRVLTLLAIQRYSYENSYVFNTLYSIAVTPPEKRHR